MRIICEECGREYETHLGNACPYCRREKEWLRISNEAKSSVRNSFPKGIRNSLSKYFHEETRNYKKVITLTNKLYQEDDDYYKSIFLYGDTGEGKTTFACALAEEILKRKFILGEWFPVYKPLYSVYDFFCVLKKSYSKLIIESETTILEQLENVPLLIVDDLGIEKGTEWEMYMLYGLVNNRSRELRTTIYTSNYSLEKLAEKIQNDRIVSRILSTSIVMNYTRIE